MRQFCLALAFLLAITAGAEAGPFRSRGRQQQQSCSSCNTVSSVSAPQQAQSYGDDQSRCQQEANTMAARRIRGYHIGGTIGRFEGVGYGSSPGCATCTPEKFGYHGLALTGDASARGSDGYWYRVRSWR